MIRFDMGRSVGRKNVRFVSSRFDERVPPPSLSKSSSLCLNLMNAAFCAFAGTISVADRGVSVKCLLVTTPGPLACPSHGARPIACPSRRAWPLSLSWPQLSAQID